jgi:predicted nucleic acid-binding Zn ribbon protein
VKFPEHTRRHKSEPEHASSLVSDVVANIGGAWRGKEQRVFAVYENIGGPFLKKHTRPDSLRNGTLFIRVPSSAIGHRLTLLRGELLEKLACLLPPGIVVDIRTRVGPIDEETPDP